MNFSQKIYANHVSLDNAVGDLEPRVFDLETESNIFQEEVLRKLHGIEKKAVEMIFDGYNFLEISKELKLKESQIYKIKRDLALKLNQLHEVSTPNRIGNIVKLYFLGKLKNMPRHIYTIWKADPALREYERPTEKMIEDYIEDVLLSIGSGVVLYRAPRRKDELYGDIQQLSLFHFQN